MKTPRDSDSLGAGIAPLARQIVAIQEQMRSLGMFANDRELLECQRCGLKEDVAHDGRLITCREPDLEKDTSLRFEPLTEQTFRCPACGQLVREPLNEDEQNEELPG